MTIYEALNEVMKEIGAVGKDKKNQQQGFKFRGVDDAMNATSHLFAKHGVFVVPEVIDRTREERTTKNGGAMYVTICRVRYTFYSVDGTSVTAVVDGEGMDTADKGTSKAQAIAFKYALFQVLDIPTEAMPDPDLTTPEDTLPKEEKSSQNSELIKSIAAMVEKHPEFLPIVDLAKEDKHVKSIKELGEPELIALHDVLAEAIRAT